MAHLMRRAGFGANRSELEDLVPLGYAQVVDRLLHPEEQPELDKSEFYRYFPQAEMSWTYLHVQMDWLHTMRNGRRPLEEKMALFWHQVFATASSKVGHSYVMAAQVELFRRMGMGNFRELLLQLGKDPAMIFWLDNPQAAQGRGQVVLGRRDRERQRHEPGAGRRHRLAREARTQVRADLLVPRRD
jgi:uncharacterized protein (DUF1800 family)